MKEKVRIIHVSTISFTLKLGKRVGLFKYRQTRYSGWTLVCVSKLYWWCWTVQTASASFSGVLKFARLVKIYETQDPEIAAMSAKLKSLLLPPLSTPPIGGAIPAS